MRARSPKREHEVAQQDDDDQAGADRQGGVGEIEHRATGRHHDPVDDRAAQRPGVSYGPVGTVAERAPGDQPERQRPGPAADPQPRARGGQCRDRPGEGDQDDQQGSAPPKTEGHPGVAHQQGVHRPERALRPHGAVEGRHRPGLAHLVGRHHREYGQREEYAAGALLGLHRRPPRGRPPRAFGVGAESGPGQETRRGDVSLPPEPAFLPRPRFFAVSGSVRAHGPYAVTVRTRGPYARTARTRARPAAPGYDGGPAGAIACGPSLSTAGVRRPYQRDYSDVFPFADRSGAWYLDSIFILFLSIDFQSFLRTPPVSPEFGFRDQ